MLRVARAALHLPRVAAPVEGQKEGLVPRQPGAHVDLVGVGRKVHQCALLELEQRRARVAVSLVLAYGVAPGLVRAGVLQLNGAHRQAIHRQHHVHGAVITGAAGHLPGHGELVLRVLRQHIGRQAMRRLEVGQPKQLAVELETVAQHLQAALDIQLLHQCIQQHGLQLVGVQRGHVLPQLGLCGLDEGEHPGREQRQRSVPLGMGAGLPAAIGQHLFDTGLKGQFRRLRHAQAPGKLASRNNSALL